MHPEDPCTLCTLIPVVAIEYNVPLAALNLWHANYQVSYKRDEKALRTIASAVSESVADVIVISMLRVGFSS